VQREKYFAQPPIELLRQWFDHGGWYERKPPCPFRSIIDTQIVGSMGPPGGGRNPVTNRLLRHFNFVSFTEMSDESISRIFTTILGAFFKKYFNEAIQQVSQWQQVCLAEAKRWTLPWIALNPLLASCSTSLSRVLWRSTRWTCSNTTLGSSSVSPFATRQVTDPLVAATVEVYNSIRASLLPTPSKSHYTFNLRDLSKVVQGCMRGDPRSTVDPKQVRRGATGCLCLEGAGRGLASTAHTRLPFGVMSFVGSCPSPLLPDAGALAPRC
jgi:hypothetical protein